MMSWLHHGSPRRNTGGAAGEAPHKLLEYFASAVILIDEWVAYARELGGREDLAGGRFETQFTIAHALREAVNAIPAMTLAIFIPTSHDNDRPDADAVGSGEEVGGENGTLALERLWNLVRRMADQRRPPPRIGRINVSREQRMPAFKYERGRADTRW